MNETKQRHFIQSRDVVPLLASVDSPSNFSFQPRLNKSVTPLVLGGLFWNNHFVLVPYLTWPQSRSPSVNSFTVCVFNKILVFYLGQGYTPFPTYIRQKIIPNSLSRIYINQTYLRVGTVLSLTPSPLTATPTKRNPFISENPRLDVKVTRTSLWIVDDSWKNPYPWHDSRNERNRIT